MSNNKRKSSSRGLFWEYCTSFLNFFPLVDDKRVDGSPFLSKFIFILYLTCVCLKAAVFENSWVHGATFKLKYFSVFSIHYFRQMHEG